MTFDGMKYRYLGNFTMFRIELVIWRIRTLENLIKERFGSIPERIRLGLVQLNPSMQEAIMQFLRGLEIWIIVNNKDEADAANSILAKENLTWPVKIHTTHDVIQKLSSLS